MRSPSVGDEVGFAKFGIVRVTGSDVVVMMLLVGQISGVARALSEQSGKYCVTFVNNTRKLSNVAILRSPSLI